jgi:ABC-type lipoprotein release transport system permease subunit
MLRAIERHRHLLDFALAALWRRRGKNTALVLLYTLVVFLLASVLFFTAAMRREAGLILAEAPEIVVQRSLLGRYEQVPLAYAETIREIRGVVAVEPRFWGYYYDPGFKANYTIVTRDEVQPGTVLIGAGVSRQRGAFVGDTLTFTGADGQLAAFQVAGVLEEESQLLTADLLVLSPDEYRRFAGVRELHATDLAVRVRNQQELATIAEKIRRLLPESRPISRSEMLRTYDALFAWRGGMVLLVIGGALLAFIIFAWDKASGLSAEERQEIGILKATGWETSDILTMKCWEGVSVSGIAFLAGGLLAYGHVFLFNGSILLGVLKGWATLYPEFRVAPTISLPQIVTLACLTIVPYSIATIIPVWRAATIDPDAVMRMG